MPKSQSVEARFGGNWSWDLDNGRKLNIGEAIVAEGPGKGGAIYPWALDRYERVLRIRPGESWLLRRMLKHAWSYGQEVFISLRALAFQAPVSRTTLHTYLSKLQQLGYVKRLKSGEMTDRRVRYDVSGLYAALAICIAVDPGSQWAKENGVCSVEEAKRLTHSGSTDRPGQKFQLDFMALKAMVNRRAELFDDGAIV